MKNNIFVASFVALTMAGANAADGDRVELTEGEKITYANDSRETNPHVAKERYPGHLTAAKNHFTNNWRSYAIGATAVVILGCVVKYFK